MYCKAGGNETTKLLRFSISDGDDLGLVWSDDEVFTELTLSTQHIFQPRGDRAEWEFLFALPLGVFQNCFFLWDFSPLTFD